MVVDAADVGNAAVDLVRDQLRNAVDAIEDAARACATMTSSSGSSTPSTPAAGDGRGGSGAGRELQKNLFARTTAALVPVKNAVAELFRALHALAATARREGDVDGDGVGGREVGTPSSGAKRSPLAKVKTWWKEKVSPGFANSPSPNR